VTGAPAPRAGHVLAIDQGTSATKALVVADDGAVRARARVAVHPRAGAGGAVEQDPEALWRSVVRAGRSALRRAGVAVEAVGLANQGETVLGWDRRSGRALGPALSWQDRRADVVCRRLRGEAATLTGITGLPLDSYFAAPKIAWLREQGAGSSVGAAAVVGTTDTWLLHRLTGTFATDAATASRTLLLDLDRGEWSPDACRIFRLDPQSLPAIQPCAGRFGSTTAFGPSLPVVAAIVDQQAALFGAGCHAPGDAKCTLGTGAFLLVTVGATAPRSSHGLGASIAWQIGGTTTYCLDGGVATAGAALDWLRRLGIGPPPGGLDRALRRAGAPEARPDFVPALAGLAAPGWRPDARGAFLGLTLGTSRDDLAAAVVDGVAAQVAELAAAAAADTGRALSRVRVDGGLTRSPRVVQAVADRLQAPVEVYPGGDATAMGVAALCRLGLGDPGGAARIASGWRPALTVAPAIGGARAADLGGRWRQALRAVTARADGER